MRTVPNRALGLFLGARLLGTLGIQVQSVAVAWQVYDLTREPIALGWVGLAQFLPLVSLSLLGGSVADRVSRKRILVVCWLGYATLASGLALLAERPESGVLPIYGVLVALGATRAFLAPASTAFLPGIVPVERLPRAIAMSSTIFQIGTIAGPALGGLVYAAGGPTAAYLTTAVFEATAAMVLFFIPAPAMQRPPETAEPGAARLFAGIRYVLRERALLGAVSLDLVAVLLGGAVALLPIYARDILHVGEAGLGLLRAAPAVGAAAVALLFAWRPLDRRAGALMLGGVGVFGVATCVFALSESFALSMASLAVLGAADMISVVVRQSLVQIRTPDEMRGRVAAVNLVFIGASNELGELESGVTAAWLGTVRAAVVGGIGTLVVTGLWAAFFPELRRIDRLSRETPAAT